MLINTRALQELVVCVKIFTDSLPLLLESKRMATSISIDSNEVVRIYISVVCCGSPCQETVSWSPQPPGSVARSPLAQSMSSLAALKAMFLRIVHYPVVRNTSLLNGMKLNLNPRYTKVPFQWHVNGIVRLE